MSRRKNYSRDQIIKRDNATCWLCGNPIDLELKVPHPRSMTLDHIVPLSRGGTDVAANVACSHKICNEVKKDSMPWEFFNLPEGIMYRGKGRTAILLICESDDDVYYIANKLSRTRNKWLKRIMYNILNTLDTE